MKTILTDEADRVLTRWFMQQPIEIKKMLNRVIRDKRTHNYSPSSVMTSGGRKRADGFLRAQIEYHGSII